MRAGPWSLKNGLVSPPILACSPVDCRWAEKGQNCGLDAVLIIGKQNMEAVVDWMWRKDCLVVKEPTDIYKLDTHFFKSKRAHVGGRARGRQRES